MRFTKGSGLRYNLFFSEKAQEDLADFNGADRVLIAKKLQHLCENFDVLKNTKKVTQLKGTQFPNQYRFVIARKIRAIFRIENQKLILLILRIGTRKNIYK